MNASYMSAWVVGCFRVSSHYNIASKEIYITSPYNMTGKAPQSKAAVLRRRRA